MRERPFLKTPVWIALLALVALVCAGLTIYLALTKDDGVAEVYVDGDLVYSVDLSKVDAPFEKEIATPYGTNVLLIQKGELRVKSADCPDELCVRQGAVSAGNPVVCLPHRLVIKMRKTGDVDEVSR